MVSFMVILSVLNFSMLNFANRLIADYAVHQSLLYDLQSAADRLRYEVRNGLSIESDYQLPNGTNIKFNYSPVETIITAERNDNQEQLTLQGIDPINGIEKMIF
jgi:hypothetical protein